MNRRKFLAACSSALAAQPARRPNILLILADDLGYGDLSSFGAPDLRTPYIDAIARMGVRFTSFYANSPVCSPTRAALMTGRNPDLVGVPGVIRTHPENSFGLLARDAILLPQVLGASGYHTALVGKWHLGLTPGDNPTARGFQHFRGFLGDMMDDYLTHRRHGINYMRDNTREIDPEGHATDLFTNWAKDYVGSRRGAAQPFFLYLAYNAPHTPIQPKSDWLDIVNRRGPRVPEPRAKLAALIEHMDSGIGEVIEALKATGQYENTLIVFTSDNGGQLSVGASCGSLRGGKQDMYEGGIRVPACASWPGRIQPGTGSAEVLQTMDIFPTLCEAAGAPAPAGIDGVSFLSSMTGGSPPRGDRTLFWVRREGGRPYYGQDYHAVRQGDWKLLHNNPFSPLELFNLRNDPLERKDLAGEEPKILTALARELQLHLQRSGSVSWNPKTLF